MDNTINILLQIESFTENKTNPNPIPNKPTLNNFLFFIIIYLLFLNFLPLKKERKIKFCSLHHFATF